MTKMRPQCICPFYGRSPDQCDIGFGYISPYHVETMVRYCTSQHQECGKYRELQMRKSHSQEVKQANRETSPLPADNPSGGLMFPLRLDRKTFTAVQHSLRTPLTSIISFSEILLEHPIDDPEAQRQFLRAIHDEAERLNHALDRLFSAEDGGDSETPAVTEKSKALCEELAVL